MLFRNIRAEMARRNLSSADMARELKISETTWRAKMRGAYPFDTVELREIKRVLGGTYEYLLDESAT